MSTSPSTSSSNTPSDPSTGQLAPIRLCVQRWHEYMRGDLAGGLDAVIHPDCVFYSPVVFTPQVGREITKMYLVAAAATLGGTPTEATPTSDAPNTGGFRYITKILEGHHAMLEFETTMPDLSTGRPTSVNGVDILTCDDDSMITEFKVMIRPLQAINLVHAQMKAALESN